MSLLPYDPFNHLESFKKDMDHFFSDLFVNIDNYFQLSDIQLEEKTDEVIATCHIPGIENKEDIHIDIQQNTLLISATVNQTKELKDKDNYKKEQYYGSFYRSVVLPCPVKDEEMQVSYKNGVLKVRIPKKIRANKDVIDIDFEPWQ